LPQRSKLEKGKNRKRFKLSYKQSKKEKKKQLNRKNNYRVLLINSKIERR
jgi:hypothetical protein